MAPIPSMTGGAGGAASTGPLTGGTSSFDASGWNVNYGAGTIASTRNDPTTSYTPYIIGGVVLLAVVLYLKRKK